MDLSIDTLPQQQQWRREVSDFLDRELPPAFDFEWDYNEDDQDWQTARDFWKKVGQKGWVSLTWPNEYYGSQRTPIEKWILHEEFNKRNAPEYPGIGLSVADSVLRLGTPEQRLRFLKGIASADILWGEGFTEPDHGSDLAGLETRAVRDGDEWVINGQKTFGTAAHRCEWMFVFARTNLDVPKHAGISAFAVPLDTPGVTLQPMVNLAGGRQNMTFFDNVRVPQDHLIGDVNEGWRQVWFHLGGEQLDRGGPAPSMRNFRMAYVLDKLIQFCKETKRHGMPLGNDPVVRLQIADLLIGVEAIKLLEYESFWRFESGKSSEFGPYLPAAYLKEFQPRFAQSCMEILGPAAQIQSGRWAPLAGAVDRMYRASYGNHAGGTSQVKRMVLATRGLGLPR